MLTDNHRFSLAEQAITAIVSRVMGMILASVAVDNVIEALRELLAGV